MPKNEKRNLKIDLINNSYEATTPWLVRKWDTCMAFFRGISAFFGGKRFSSSDKSLVYKAEMDTLMANEGNTNRARFFDSVMDKGQINDICDIITVGDDIFPEAEKSSGATPESATSSGDTKEAASIPADARKNPGAFWMYVKDDLSLLAGVKKSWDLYIQSPHTRKEAKYSEGYLKTAKILSADLTAYENENRRPQGRGGKEQLKFIKSLNNMLKYEIKMQSEVLQTRDPDDEIKEGETTQTAAPQTNSRPEQHNALYDSLKEISDTLDALHVRSDSSAYTKVRNILHKILADPNLLNDSQRSETLNQLQDRTDEYLLHKRDSTIRRTADQKVDSVLFLKETLENYAAAEKQKNQQGDRLINSNSVEQDAENAEPNHLISTMAELQNKVNDNDMPEIRRISYKEFRDALDQKRTRRDGRKYMSSAAQKNDTLKKDAPDRQMG